MIPFIKNPDNWPTDANETWWQNGYYDDNVNDVDDEEEEHDDDDDNDGVLCKTRTHNTHA